VLFLLPNTLSPVDQCGCGDTGYLTSRTLPIALNHGVGKVVDVPVYACNNSLCDKYNLPAIVASRLDEIADDMEAKGLLSAKFSWSTASEAQASDDQVETKDKADFKESLVEGFVWSFHQRNYEDAKVILVLHGDTVVLQSKLDPTEYYVLKRMEESREGIFFSFSKFFEDDTELTYEKYIALEPSFQKLLGTIKLEEVEDIFIDEFGEVCD